jgi:hypothetical protein
MTSSLSDSFDDALTCAAGHAARARFRFQSSEGPLDKCLRHALGHVRVVRTALATAAVVGTILALINQGNLMFAGEWRADMAWKIPMTYCVPYGVVTWSALRTAWRG